MADDDGPGADRPREVTIGAWVAGGCSGVMLLVVGSVLSRIRTVEFQDGLAKALRDAGMTMSADSASNVVRIGLMAVGAVAAAMLVFSIFVARRDRSARIAMTVLAVPMLLIGMFVQPLLAGFAVASTAMLWRGPAADWFAGRPIRRTPTAPPTLPPQPSAPVAPVAPATPPTAVDLSALPPPVVAQAPVPPPARSSAERPRRLVLAAAIAMVSSAIVAVLMGATAALIGSDSMHDQLVKVLRDNPSATTQGLTVHQLAVAVVVMCVGLVVWCLGAIVFAWLALVGHSWARIALIVSAAAAGVFALLGVLAFPGCLVITGAAAVTVAGLLHPDTSAWYAARRGGAKPPVVRPPSQPW